MKRLFLIRHCHAEGQHKDSPLTKKGVKQAQVVASFLEDSGYDIDKVISSPYLRAIESIKPYAERKKLVIGIDERLQERVLSEEPVEDWMEALEQSFYDLDFKLPGGESSNDALQRVSNIMDEIQHSDAYENIAIVTHGNLLAILLKKFQADVGFSHWKGFTNPDMYLVQKTGGEYVVERIWED